MGINYIIYVVLLFMRFCIVFFDISDYYLFFIVIMDYFDYLINKCGIGFFVKI